MLSGGAGRRVVMGGKRGVRLLRKQAVFVSAECREGMGFIYIR